MFGWNVTMAMCYPPAEAIAVQILAALRRWNLSRVFIATDSPRPELFEDILTARGVTFSKIRQTRARGGAYEDATVSAEFALPVDVQVCAEAPYFLGNVPSTVTATIVQERDVLRQPRSRTDFFGFGPHELGEFRAYP